MQKDGLLPAEPLPNGPSRYPTAYVPEGYEPPPQTLLCPALYELLRSRYGKVLVSNDGMAQHGHMTMEVREQKYINRWRVYSWGETYRICCPFCQDRRYRLWINHAYGKADPAFPNQRGNFYGICFNEGCLEDSDNREWFYEDLFRLRNRNERAAPMLILQGTIPENRLIEREKPGQVELITSLPHLPGLGWLVGDRRFSPEILDRYGVQLCLQTFKKEFRLAQGRIIIPIRMHGQYVGWQARCIGEPPNKSTPKYFTCPGMPVRQILYNYDRAKASPYIVLFEGVTDVWRYGDCSMAMLGKSLKYEQSLLLGSTFQNRQPIIFCLDPDAWDDSALTIHQMEQLCPNPLIRVRLPDGWDPATLDRSVLHTIIRTQAAEKGITLPATAP